MKKHIIPQGESKPLSKVVNIDEAKLQDHLGSVVRNTVESTLNQMLDAEADQLCGAKKYERTNGRASTRAGSYNQRKCLGTVK